MEIPPHLETQIDEAITHYPVSKRSAVLPLLHLMQHQFRYITDEAVTWVLGTDRRNADLVATTRGRANLVVPQTAMPKVSAN